LGLLSPGCQCAYSSFVHDQHCPTLQCSPGIRRWVCPEKTGCLHWPNSGSGGGGSIPQLVGVQRGGLACRSHFHFIYLCITASAVPVAKPTLKLIPPRPTSLRPRLRLIHRRITHTKSTLRDQKRAWAMVLLFTPTTHTRKRSARFEAQTASPFHEMSSKSCTLTPNSRQMDIFVKCLAILRPSHWSGFYCPLRPTPAYYTTAGTA
jgi:hypothetical protein